MKYTEIQQFADLFFEDSYVLDIIEIDNSLTFVLDLVLCPGHQAYTQPKPGEAHCYKLAKMIFLSTHQVIWQKREFNRFADKSGEEDIGNIDAFDFDGTFYNLEGDWGRVSISCDLVSVAFSS